MVGLIHRLGKRKTKTGIYFFTINDTNLWKISVFS
jgi:hypothetical protein